MSRDWRLRIEDILESIAKINDYATGHTVETFGQNSLVIDAVVRNLEIIGEAATHLPEEIQRRHTEIPWQEMKGMRNLLAHEYFGVSTPIVWTTIQNNLPPLVPLLKKMLASK